MEELVCAECGLEILSGESYIEVEDNFLRAKYFDSREDAIFCCEDCLLKNISADHKVKE